MLEAPAVDPSTRHHRKACSSQRPSDGATQTTDRPWNNSNLIAVANGDSVIGDSTIDADSMIDADVDA
jgi:hypothetical protein